MKELILIRHAQAEQGSATNRDYDRNLSQEGLGEANRAGEILHHLLKEIPYILASPANRTRQTAECIAAKWGDAAPEVHFSKEIYQGNREQFMDLLTEIPDEHSNALLVAHNPGIHHFVEYLMEEELEQFRPCTVAILHLDIQKWTDLKPGILFSRLIKPDELTR